MSGFRDSEKVRQASLAGDLFSRQAAVLGGLYKGAPRPFCLPRAHAAENLHRQLRQGAIDYFAARKIPWHDGQGTNKRLPSNHLCCSQSSCVNALFPFRDDKNATTELLRALGYEGVAEALPILDDEGEDDGFVGFEWIGAKNYLGEGAGGKPTADAARTRGANNTSADFILRFRTETGVIHVVIGEWKYTEMYPNNAHMRWSAGGTDRLSTYGPHLGKSKLLQRTGLIAEGLFFEPFYQLLRLQLLAWHMKKAKEMGAGMVSLLHVAPEGNTEFMGRITSPHLRHLGSDVHEVWSGIALPAAFAGVTTAKLIGAATTVARPQGWDDWADWVQRRYPR